jgi:delta14-sterol reductase
VPNDLLPTTMDQPRLTAMPQTETTEYDASSDKVSQQALNPRSKHYEFAGPAGAAFVTLTVPLTAYGLFFACNEQMGGCPPPLRSVLVNALDSASDPAAWASLWDTRATAIYLGWYAFCLAAWYAIPGSWVEGPPLRGGRGTVKYKINGTRHFVRPTLKPPTDWSCFQ